MNPDPETSGPGLKTAGKSSGGLYVAVGLLVLLVGELQFPMPGGLWPTYLVSCAFSCWGIFRSRVGFKRCATIAVAIVSGFLCLRDLFSLF